MSTAVVYTNQSLSFADHVWKSDLCDISEVTNLKHSRKHALYKPSSKKLKANRP